MNSFKKIPINKNTAIKNDVYQGPKYHFETFLDAEKIDESLQNISLSERQKYQLMIRYFHRIFVLSINSIMFLLFTVR